MTIAQNVARVRERIAAAALRSGRTPQAVKLIAVSKYVDAERARELVDAGCLDLGEARPQELWQKAEVLRDPSIRWHLIGHLQTNKVRRTLPLASLIHSVDTEKLIESINTEAASQQRQVPVLLEVNISGDVAKHGFPPEAVAGIISQASRWPHVRIRGLMGMAALEGGLDVARRNFSLLSELRDQLKAVCPPEASLDELSMGMSEDFEVAIEEGATMVRVGSLLFE